MTTLKADGIAILLYFVFIVFFWSVCFLPIKVKRIGIIKALIIIFGYAGAIYLIRVSKFLKEVTSICDTEAIFGFLIFVWLILLSISGAITPKYGEEEKKSYLIIQWLSFITPYSMIIVLPLFFSMIAK